MILSEEKIIFHHNLLKQINFYNGLLGHIINIQK